MSVGDYDSNIDIILRVAARRGVPIEGKRPFTITEAVERLIAEAQHSIANRLQVKLLALERKECIPQQTVEG